MTKPERGVKRVCASFGARFFDLHHEPIICPKCLAVFVIPELPPPRPSAFVSKPKRAALTPVEEAPEDLLEPDEEETLPAPEEEEEADKSVDEDEEVPQTLDEVIDAEVGDLGLDDLPDDE